jgi:hypothetical protein
VLIAKQWDGRLVQIVKVAHSVGFSDQKDWILLCLDFEKPRRKQQEFRWVSHSTTFQWLKQVPWDGQ